MDSDVGVALRSVNTSRQWSVLSAVVTKINKKLPTSTARISEEELIEFLGQFTRGELRLGGIWVDDVGSGSVSIICINPAYRRARSAAVAEHKTGEEETCSCAVKSDKEEKEKRYFGSFDYNAGRHASSQSKHNSKCIKWKPAPSGHLHSWRRGHSNSSLGEKKGEPKKKKSLK